ncbi:MAG TPA: hypothetical protein VFE90_16825 [Myxococcales bacterium]|jgi:hypothetical protein|nr:hypothetical protein [Myxococcales bacterium]
MPWALLAALLAVAPVVPEGDAQAYTSLIDAKTGAAIADGRYAQWVKDDVLHIEARYDFPDGRSVVERAAVRLHPQLVQESWDWTERKGEALIRQYEVDFHTRRAVATRVDQHKRWKEDLDIEPGKTFAGIAFVAVIKALRDDLAPGQKFDLKAVAFTPKPRIAPVNVIRRGAENIEMAGRSLPADHYTIHPDIPGVVKLFVKAPDQEVWLFGGGPPAFLRFQGPMAEPDDPVIRVDLIPAPSPSAKAEGRRSPPPKR